MPYPINAKHQARKQQISILYATGLTRPGTEHSISCIRGRCSTELVLLEGILKADFIQQLAKLLYHTLLVQRYTVGESVPDFSC